MGKHLIDAWSFREPARYLCVEIPLFSRFKIDWSVADWQTPHSKQNKERTRMMFIHLGTNFDD